MTFPIFLFTLVYFVLVAQMFGQAQVEGANDLDRLAGNWILFEADTPSGSKLKDYELYEINIKVKGTEVEIIRRYKFLQQQMVTKEGRFVADGRDEEKIIDSKSYVTRIKSKTTWKKGRLVRKYKEDLKGDLSSIPKFLRYPTSGIETFVLSENDTKLKITDNVSKLFGLEAGSGNPSEFVFRRK